MSKRNDIYINLLKTEGWYAFFDRPLVVCCFKLIF